LGVFLAELEAHYPSVLVPEDISLPDGRLIRTRKQFIRDSVDILVNGEVSGLSANLGADLRRSSLLFQVAVADRSQMDTRQQAAYVCERVLELCGGDMTQLDLVSIVATQALGVTLYERLISRYKNDGCVITQAGSTLIYAIRSCPVFAGMVLYASGCHYLNIQVGKGLLAVTMRAIFGIRQMPHSEAQDSNELLNNLPSMCVKASLTVDLVGSSSKPPIATFQISEPFVDSVIVGDAPAESGH
jgi:hypothetical protein